MSLKRLDKMLLIFINGKRKLKNILYMFFCDFKFNLSNILFLNDINIFKFSASNLKGSDPCITLFNNSFSIVFL